MTEGEFQKQVTDLASLEGWLWTHTPDSRRVQGDNGFPDLVLARGGQVIFAELKRSPKEKLSDDQERWKEALEDTVHWSPAPEWYLWTPDDWDEIRAKLW